VRYLGFRNPLPFLPQAYRKVTLLPFSLYFLPSVLLSLESRVIFRYEMPSSPIERLDRIVLVHRLREVVAQVGFTRFEPSYANIDGELTLNVQSAALAAEPRWFPAIENKGEGVFISFNPAAIDTWKETQTVKQRGRELLNGHQTWLARTGRKAEDFPFPGLSYVMLHSLSHLLITTVSLECGYSASAIKERVYASDKYGYGILLYTGSSGSEGTLGGLVQVGKRIESILANVLEFGRLCSNDPVCAQHKPAEANEERFLHGAACHGCLLIAETSCEKGNEFLVGEASPWRIEHWSLTPSKIRVQPSSPTFYEFPIPSTQSSLARKSAQIDCRRQVFNQRIWADHLPYFTYCDRTSPSSADRY
jgi:Domain of unknown function (DUF1998)